MTGGVSSVVNKFWPSSMLIAASVDLVYISRRVRRREQNRILFVPLSRTGLQGYKLHISE